ncbi:MAG: MEDS domain-containing protein [Betaproteobacteria bacterium]
MDTAIPWNELLKHPAAGGHIAQVVRDEAFLAEAVAQYAAWGLELGQAVLLVVSAERRTRLLHELEARGVSASPALCVVDADALLDCLMREGKPGRAAFRDIVGTLVAELRFGYPAVRAYGEMVDLLCRRGERSSALMLEQYWSELAREQGLAVFCAYTLDLLDPGDYATLRSVCQCHTHLIPARDYAGFNAAVTEVAKAVLDQPLAQMMLSLSAAHCPATQMPMGQATLLWLRQHMPRTAEKVLRELRSRLAPA